MRGTVSLPHAVGETSTGSILVFADSDDAEIALRMGATFAGGDELIDQVKEGKIKFDRCLCTKKMFPKVVKIAKILGPLGLMPSPAKGNSLDLGTVSDDIKSLMSSVQASSSIEMKDGFIELAIGQSTWPDTQLQDNLIAFVKAVKALKPPKMDEKQFLQTIAVSSPQSVALEFPRRPFQ